MTPENWLRSMCERHGLPAEYGAHLIPLVRRAMEAPDEVRERILTLVEGNLVQRAKGGQGLGGAWCDLDNEILVAVARVLHNWAPSEPMLDLGMGGGGIGPAPETR